MNFSAMRHPWKAPRWHEDELRSTEAEFAARRIEQLDWQDAKKELRNRFK